MIVRGTRRIAVTMTNTIACEETVHRLASLLLIFRGGGHSHAHNHPNGKDGSHRSCTCTCIITLCNNSSNFPLCWKVFLNNDSCDHCAPLQVINDNYLALKNGSHMCFILAISKDIYFLINMIYYFF